MSYSDNRMQQNHIIVNSYMILKSDFIYLKYSRSMGALQQTNLELIMQNKKVESVSLYQRMRLKLEEKKRRQEEAR